MVRGIVERRAAGALRSCRGAPTHLEHLKRLHRPSPCEFNVELTPRERDKLLLFTAALLAERRLVRGLKLNYPEAVAYISAAIMEGARDGRGVSDLMSRRCSRATMSWTEWRS